MSSITQKTYYYTDTDIELSTKHYEMFDNLLEWRKDILLRQAEWKIYNMPHTIVKLFGGKDINEPTDEMYKYFEKYTTPQILIQNLTGSFYKLSNAKELILKQVQYRCLYDIDNITPEKCEEGLKLGSVYSLNKTTKYGNPIGYFNIPTSMDKEEYKNIFLSFILTIEKMSKIAKKNEVNQFYWIYDLSELSLLKLPCKSLTIELIKFGNDYYPDSVYKIYMLFAPRTFRIIWKVISPIVGEEQKKRMLFPSWDKSQSYETFKDNVDKHNLHKKSGGELDIDYSYKWEVEKWNENEGYVIE